MRGEGLPPAMNNGGTFVHFHQKEELFLMEFRETVFVNYNKKITGSNGKLYEVKFRICCMVDQLGAPNETSYDILETMLRNGLRFQNVAEGLPEMVGLREYCIFQGKLPEDVVLHIMNDVRKPAHHGIYCQLRLNVDIESPNGAMLRVMGVYKHSSMGRNDFLQVLEQLCKNGLPQGAAELTDGMWLKTQTTGDSTILAQHIAELRTQCEPRKRTGMRRLLHRRPVA